MLSTALAITATALTTWHPNVVLIGIAVTFGAVLEVPDAFLDMLAPNLFG